MDIWRASALLMELEVSRQADGMLLFKVSLSGTVLLVKTFIVNSVILFDGFLILIYNF